MALLEVRALARSFCGVHALNGVDLGGTGNNWGAVIGAALAVFFLESTRFATAWLPGLAPVQVAAVREFVMGLSVILVLRLRPARLLPERLPRMALPVVPKSERL